MKQRSSTKQNVLLGLLVLAVFYFWPQLSSQRDNSPRPVLAAPTAVPLIIYVMPPSAATPAPAPQTIILDPINPNEAPAPAAVSSAELQAVTVALETSQKVASACLQAWIKANMKGEKLPNCENVLQQVSDLSFKKLELEREQ